ncbi:UNVERIFIED_CONTAM: hypothetical protein Sangu_2177500 [Sesamum angustifolium]|uniref:Hydrophobic seed protein domain-containing protein n=1 Tax=Sesamum angustifolium TaxID=2727405 RepID=A0AAW2LGE1_9LAMI
MALIKRTLSSATLLLLLLSSILFSSASDLAAVPAPQTLSTPEVGTIGTCKVDTAPCFDLFRNLMHWTSTSDTKPQTFHTCCPIICGLATFEAASCLCSTFKSCFFGILIDYHWSMSMVMNFCGLPVPRHFKCS